MAATLFDFSYFLSMEALFPSNKTVFFNEFFIPACVNRLFSLFEKVFFYSENILLLVENEKSNIWKITSFRLVETDFFAKGNQFFLPFSDNAATKSFIFPPSGNVILNESAFRLVKTDFLAGEINLLSIF